MANLLIITREKEAPAGLGDSLAGIGMDYVITSYANGVREAIIQQLPDVILFELTEHPPNEAIRGLFKGIKRGRNLPIIALVSQEMLGSIVDLMVKDLQKRLEERKLSIEVTAAARSWLAREGFDPVYGARPLRRAIERHVENPLSTKLLSGEFKEDDAVTVDLVDNGLVFTAKEAAFAAS